MQDAIMRMKQVIVDTGVSRSSIYEKMNPKSKYFDPAFPKPLKLGSRSIGFLSSELESWKGGLSRVA